MPNNDAMRDEERIGIGRTLAYAMGIWPTDIVSRLTLRALLPPGKVKWKGALSHARWMAGETNTSKTRNVTSERFKAQLEKYEREGLILRGTEFVRVLDHRELFDRALAGIDNPRHRKFLAIDEAAEKIEAQIRDEDRSKVADIRKAELAFVRSLMIPGDYAGRDGRRRLVREESGAITIPLGATTGIRQRSAPNPTFPVHVERLT